MNTPARLRSLEELVALFTTAGRASFRKRGTWRNPGGATLRPGPATPLWNDLVAQIRPLVKRRGEKAQLARLLGMHRQAMTDFFTSGSRMPDAERTLLLQEWLRARQAGERPSR